MAYVTTVCTLSTNEMVNEDPRINMQLVVHGVKFGTYSECYYTQ